MILVNVVIRETITVVQVVFPIDYLFLKHREIVTSLLMLVVEVYKIFLVTDLVDREIVLDFNGVKDKENDWNIIVIIEEVISYLHEAVLNFVAVVDIGRQVAEVRGIFNCKPVKEVDVVDENESIPTLRDGLISILDRSDYVSVDDVVVIEDIKPFIVNTHVITQMVREDP